MHVKITTTITTLIDIDTMKPEHSVVIEAEDGVPESFAKAAAVGACKTVLNQLDKPKS